MGSDTNNLEARLELLEKRVKQLAVTVMAAYALENKTHGFPAHYTDEALEEIYEKLFGEDERN